MKEIDCIKKSILFQSRKRPRWTYALLVIASVLVGLLSRKMAFALPSFLNVYLGDAVWALMVYFILAFLFQRWPISRVALSSLLFCFFIETSQFYQAEWINQIRHTFIGGVVLGFGFLWTDLVAYSIGVLSGILLEWYSLLVFPRHLY